MVDLRLTDRIAGNHILITGGTSGIGEASLRAFAGLGGQVTFCGRRERLGRALERELAKSGQHVRYFSCDVRDGKQVKAFIASAVEAFGPPVLAFNNAGISHSTALIQDLPSAEVRDVFETNVTGLWHCMRAEIAHMSGAGGIIVNMASALASTGAGWLGAYGASKHAVLGLTRSAALELEDTALKVLAISPGPVRTPMFERALRSLQGHPERFAGGFPPDGILEPEQVADFVVEIASGDVVFSNGADLAIEPDYAILGMNQS